MATVHDNIQRVLTRIEQACDAAGRSSHNVTLLAVSKTFGADAVREAYSAGLRHFGENYLQEALDKQAELADLRPQLTWHFIGPLQSNKTKPVAEQFDWVHSVDRLKIAQRLSQQRPPQLAPLNICLQVNVSSEASKSGVAPGEVQDLALAVSQLPGLQLRGLMAIPAPAEGLAAQREPYRVMRQLLQQLQDQGLTMADTLSMGMSQDLEAAIFEGATCVRIGTALFGGRPSRIAAEITTN